MHPKQIILFGSHVHGQADEGSDLDIMVIVPDSDQPSYRRAQAAYACVGAIGIPKDIIVLTEEEFERQSQVTSSLAREVKEGGRTLYERPHTSRNSQLVTQESIHLATAARRS